MLLLMLAGIVTVTFLFASWCIWTSNTFIGLKSGSLKLLKPDVGQMRAETSPSPEVQAIIATVFNQGAPCDKPLKYYMIATLLWGQAPAWASTRLRRGLDGPYAHMAISVLFSLPGWGLLAYGAPHRSSS